MHGMTDEQAEAHVAALRREREGYVLTGKNDRLKAVDEQLEQFGAKAEAPAKRAEKRPAAKAAAETRG